MEEGGLEDGRVWLTRNLTCGRRSDLGLVILQEVDESRDELLPDDV